MDNSAHTRDHRNENRSFEEQEPPKGPGTVPLEDNSFQEQEPPKGPGTVELNG